jgi:DNA processing protein
MIEMSYILHSEDDQKWCKANNIHITYPGQSDYPEALLELNLRPGVLFYIGQPIWLNYNLISVVGSRVPQNQSLVWLDEQLGEVLKNNKYGVVSGGARGVDQKAHQIALRTESPTMIVLPSGLRNVYPDNIQEYFEPVIKGGGCVLSQFLPSQPMKKYFFRERNRIIAAISPVTLVVECKRRSGTLLTANFVLDFEKKLAVMPTFPGQAGMGGLDLICDKQASPIRDHYDLQMLLNRSAKVIHAKNQENHIGNNG